MDAIRIQTLNFRSSHVRGQCLDLSRLKTFTRYPTGSWRSMLITNSPISSISAWSDRPYYGNPVMEYDHINSANDAAWDWDCTLGGLVDRMLLAACCRPEAVESEADAAERRWNVTFVDTVQLGHLAVGRMIVRFVDGRGLVPTDMKCRGNPNEMRAKVAHPNLPVFR